MVKLNMPGESGNEEPILSNENSNQIPETNELVKTKQIQKKVFYKRKKPLSDRHKNILTVVFSGSIVLTLVFSGLTFFYIDNIKPSNNITADEVYKSTKFKSSDPAIIVKMKDKALDDYILTGSNKTVTQLNNLEKKIYNITDGHYGLNKANSSLKELSKNKDFTSSDINEILKMYYNARLKVLNERMDYNLKRSDSTDTTDVMNSGNELLILDKSITNNSDMSSVTSSEDFNNSISMLSQLSDNINEVNSIKKSLKDYNNAISELQHPITPWGRDYSKQVNSFNNYIKAKNYVNDFNKRFNELKDQLNKNNDFIKKSNDMPDLMNKNVNEATDILNKIGVKLNVEKANDNSKYKNGDNVPNPNEGIKWDGDKDDQIIIQNENPNNWKFVYEGATINVTVINQSVEKPVEKKIEKPVEKNPEKEESNDNKDDDKNEQKNSSQSTSSSSSSTKESSSSQINQSSSSSQQTQKSSVKD